MMGKVKNRVLNRVSFNWVKNYFCGVVKIIWILFGLGVVFKYGIVRIL